ncbi:hypothetical protein BCR39DRAFT_462052 [Naematelia encephala]|uniref:DHHA2 domain-containing protein n=1 Tax=Naematelia encephala TaxID=71784 RepID=A0A1Y2BIQ9_9TREE|nr:hypothetical protein BCR39DRAFT_462052 [Naematelia encephala]
MTTLSPPIAIEQSHDVDATSADATGNGVGVGSGSGIGNVDGGNGIEFGRLAAFLQSQKESFLGEIREGRGKGWTVVMGNEAGDLDTLASSIAFSFLSSTLLANRTVPLSLTPSTLLGLRPENLLAFKLANVPPTTLLHTEQLTSTSALTTSGVEYALVDHNKLLPPFGPGIVNAIIDHHDDEGAHPDAGVRVIQVPTGSCASLVTRQFRKQWESSLSSPAGLNGSPVPPELATLLLSAILIDTNGLKSGGKATPTDYESAAFLYPLLTLSSSSDTQSLSVSSSSVPDGLSQVATQLLQTKFDVSGFSTHDLLLRDYKEYSLSTSSKAYPVVQLGLSTVPVALKISLDKEQDGWTSYLSSLDDYMVEKQLDIEGVLTSYQSEKKNKHKRELLLVVRVGGAIPDSATAKKVLDELSIGLEASQVLQLGEWAKKGFKRFLGKKVVLDDVKGGRHAKVWQQGNAKATRKQVAPILVRLCSSIIHSTIST